VCEHVTCEPGTANKQASKLCSQQNSVLSTHVSLQYVYCNRTMAFANMQFVIYNNCVKDYARQTLTLCACAHTYTLFTSVINLS
jgi:hypothetical protein